jgi:hypothetical protein
MGIMYTSMSFQYLEVVGFNLKGWFGRYFYY